jgi:hypothetical protein
MFRLQRLDDGQAALEEEIREDHDEIAISLFAHRLYLRD